MEIEVPKQNGMRRTTKMAITGSFILLAIRPLKDLKDFILDEQVVTNARIEKTIVENFAALNKKLDDHITAEASAHERIHDLNRGEVVFAEARCEKRSDKLELRVANLELVRMLGTSLKKQN